MYENETWGSDEELQAQIKDLQEKVAYLDNHFNHKNFSLTTKEGKEIFFENFLAKEILAAVRKTLVGKAVHEDMVCEKTHCRPRLDEER